MFFYKMKSIIKNNSTYVNKKEGGFVELIVIIVIALLLMKYFGITVSGAIDWFLGFFRDVLK